MTTARISLDIRRGLGPRQTTELFPHRRNACLILSSSGPYPLVKAFGLLIAKRRPLSKSGRDHESIALAVFEHLIRAPWLLLRRTFKFHSARTQLLVRLINVVTFIRHVHEGADAFLVSLRREQHHARLRLWHAQFDPPLLSIKWLIRDNRESEFLRIKVQRAILIADRDADEFDLFDHNAANLNWSQHLRPETTDLFV